MKPLSALSDGMIVNLVTH